MHILFNKQKVFESGTKTEKVLLDDGDDEPYDHSCKWRQCFYCSKNRSKRRQEKFSWIVHETPNELTHLLRVSTTHCFLTGSLILVGE